MRRLCRIARDQVTGHGDERYRRNRAAGVIDRAVAVHGSGEYNDYMARAAEDFFGARYGLPLPNNRRPTEVEFKVGSYGIDVKWTPYPDGHLIHYLHSRTRADLYVLVIGAKPEHFRIAGWQTGARLHGSVVGPPKFKVPTYALRQDQLRSDIDAWMAAHQSRPTDHPHAWMRTPDRMWVCSRCAEPYVGQVPIDAEHPDGYQGLTP